jgi:hypothetical protein
MLEHFPDWLNNKTDDAGQHQVSLFITNNAIKV